MLTLKNQLGFKNGDKSFVNENQPDIKKCRNLSLYHAGSVALLLFLARVTCLVEVGEEEEEHDSVEADPHHETLWVVALGEKQLELV